MEKIKSENPLYTSLNNCWDYVINYLDINSLFQLELTSKYFRNQIESFYETKERIKKINNENNTNKKNKKKKNFKHKFLSSYFNLMIQTSIENKEFCNVESQKENNNELISMNLNKEIFPKTETTFFKNKNQIEQIYLNKNQFFILYSNNTFMIIEFDIKLKSFKEQLNYDFKSIIIKNFSYSELENTIFFLEENSQIIYLLNLNNSNYEILKYENPNFILEDNITNIYFLKDFILLLNDKDEFYYFSNENFFQKNINEEDKKEIKKEENKEEEIEENEEELEKKIEKQIKLEKKYKKIKYITSSLYNIILLNEENQLYSISITEYKNQNKKKNPIPNFKLLFEQKFNDFYTMNNSDNYFILLEKKKIPPFEEWKSEENSNWFEEMNLDEYLNIIKYKNITGRDIIKGGKEYLIDFMGIQEDHLNKINYEMSIIKKGSFKNMKLWGWGSNKNGQLGFVNYINFSKNPILINLPNLIDDDTIEKIFCGKNFSVLLSKFGNIFITGNYLVKDKEKEKNKNYNINDINNNNNSNLNKGKNDKGKKNNKEKNKGKKHKKDFEKENIKNEKKEDENQILNDNRWVNISKDICYCYYNINLNDKKNENEDNENSYFQTKEIFNIENNLFFLGYYSNEIPFSAILKKPKFKHLKKGGKFITSTKVIEHIQEFLNDKIDNYNIVYGDSLLKILESPLDEFIESEIPHHKIIQIKTKENEIIWDRKKRYFKENFINYNLNKIK